MFNLRLRAEVLASRVQGFDRVPLKGVVGTGHNHRSNGESNGQDDGKCLANWVKF